MPVRKNVSEFKTDLKRASKLLDLKYQTVFRSFMLTLLEKTAYRTPVRTGRAAGSWSISRDAVGTFVIPEHEHSTPDAAILRAGRLAFSNPYAKWYLYNLVPYAFRLEYEGWSDQAPEGMMRISVEEMRALVSGIIANVR
jgi:hypothetical protein